MGSFLALVIIILVALLVVKIGSSALLLTGMSRPMARFQAASAFFGVGFTTSESEKVVCHPVRRRIILHLIIAGNIGLTSALATLLVTMMGSNERGVGVTFAWLGVIALSLLAVALFFNLRLISGPVDRLIRATLEKAGVKRVIDYDYLLNLEDGFCVFDGEIHHDHPWIGRELHQIRPADEGIIVLGIYRKDGDFIGAPKKDTSVGDGDVLMVYGRDETVREVFSETIGD